jgi:hypothetical protein
MHLKSVLRGLCMAGILLLSPATATAAGPAAPPFSNTDYWALADRMMTGLDAGWDPRRGYYEGTVRSNSGLLMAHSIAALRGHQGPTRRDGRARMLVHRLTSTPVWLGAGSYGNRPSLSTCWSMLMDRARPQHSTLESKVAEALAWAWRARRPLRLSPKAARRIVRRLTACAYSPPYRVGTRVVNQISWNADIYASAAIVSGRRSLLVRDYRRQLARFANAIDRPAPGMFAPNLGRNYQFHYAPDRPESAGINIDSPEYANIVVYAIAHYDRALRRGMRPLPARSMRRMRAWVERLIAGSWTHAGYLNWDTGKGMGRWHSAQYWAFAQQGLLAIAASPRFWPSRAYGRWAKAMFDRSLMLYRRLADENGTLLAPGEMFGVRSPMHRYDCFCARELGTITRAIAMGLGALPAEDPPPLYAFDYDTGRLAVTTPRYSTAVVPDDRGVLRYGGIELARLFGPDQKPAAHIGGRPPAGFGIRVTGDDGRTVLASQGISGGAHGATLRLTRAPRGAARALRPYPARPYGGPFRTLEARGSVRRGGVRVRTRHRFERAAIETTWRVTCRARCGGRNVAAYFPTWGRGARIEAVLRDGTRVRLARAGVSARSLPRLGEIATLTFGRPGAGGYRLRPLRGPAGATLRVVRPRRRRTNPHPGPSLVIRLGAASRSLTVRIEPTG